MKKFFSNVKGWWSRHKPSKRRLIQLYAALLFNANLKGYITGNIYQGNTKYLCVPGLNCYSCPGAVGSCPLGALQNALAKSGTTAPYYVFGILILFGLLLGRTICGFLCPFGLVQDLAYKIKTPKLKKSRVTRILSYFKYIILIVFAVAIPLSYGAVNPTPGFCEFICPAGTFGGALGLLLNRSNADLYAQLGPLFAWKFCIMVVFLVASVFIFRFFCRFFCPLGAIYGLFNRIALLGVKLDKNKCTDCGLCVDRCKMDIRRVGDHECINCGECIDVCPAKAISWKGSKLFLHKNAVETEAETEKANLLSPSPAAALPAAVSSPASAPGSAEEIQSSAPPEETAGNRRRKKIGRETLLRIAAWTLALLTLAGALVYYNFLAKDGTQKEIYEVGDVLPDYRLPFDLGGEGTFSVHAQHGKVLVMNFWATWCGSCVKEIPDFERLQNVYAEDVVVAIIDGDLLEPPEDALAAIEELGWTAYRSRFLHITEENDVYRALGGTGPLPMTAVLDREGTLRFLYSSSVSYETLEEAVLSLL